MRLSANPDDPAFSLLRRLRHAGMRVQIYLDGIEQVQVNEADEEEGYLVRAVLDQHGKLQLDPHNPDHALVERCEGVVQIVVESGPGAAA